MESTPEAVSANTRSRCALKRKALLKGLEIVKRKRAPKKKSGRASKSLALGNLAPTGDENMNLSNVGRRQATGTSTAASSKSFRRKIHSSTPSSKPLTAQHIPDQQEEEKENAAAIEKVVVLETAEIIPAENPTLECGSIQANIDHPNWLVQYETIDSIRRLVVHNFESLKPALEIVLPFLRKGAESLRSAQSRNALLALQELFKFAGAGNVSVLLCGIDKTVDVILIKSVSDKRFIAVAGVNALHQIGNSVPSIQLLSALLKHADSKSIKVLTQVGIAAAICVRGMDVKADIPEAKLGHIIKSVMLLESGRSVEARKHAQEVLRELNRGVGGSTFAAVASKSLSSSDCERAKKLVTKPRKPAAEKKPSLKELMMHRRRLAKKDTQSSGSGT